MDTNSTKTPRTPAQAAASRANGAKSAGPRDTSLTRFNSLKHGYYAKSACLSAEDPAAIQLALDHLIEIHSPNNHHELACLEYIALADVRYRRTLAAEAGALEIALARTRDAVDAEFANPSPAVRLAAAEQHLHSHDNHLELIRRQQSRARRDLEAAFRQFLLLRKQTPKNVRSEPENLTLTPEKESQ